MYCSYAFILDRDVMWTADDDVEPLLEDGSARSTGKLFVLRVVHYCYRCLNV